ncbi:putative transcription factor WRKY family [Lupinus albus]|uniref:Putative transcription factor WRKY family n=1 Tax=Lupinus albus TaxID=3870 RepID=A0A6A4NK15_LUPAL|nr:putative transcription factor WRKY family [Lupinus albus]
MASSSDLGEIINAPAPELKEQKIILKTKSEVDVLDDGYKWRKYGKKMVKSSPYPRNYYKCSAYGCPVKKRVERERDDPTYVITTYEGIHTHSVPT